MINSQLELDLEFDTRHFISFIKKMCSKALLQTIVQDMWLILNQRTK